MFFLLGVVPLPFHFILSVCEFRWNIYCGLRVLVREHPSVDSMYLVSVAWCLDSVWTPVTPFLARICWPLSLWERVWLVLEELDPTRDEVGLLCPVSPAALPGVWVNPQAAGIGTLRVTLGWGLFPLSVPLLPTLGHWSKGGDPRTRWRLYAYRGWVWCLCRYFRLCSVIAQSHVFCSLWFSQI